jgi:murein DD-endopeptidase MepM/ murein hydrolase activator NlpD
MVALTLPFTGLWLVQNSPARRVPGHGTDLLGERYAICGNSGNSTQPHVHVQVMTSADLSVAGGA